MKTKLTFILLWIILLVTSACSLNQNKDNQVWLANPASTYCQENGWKLEIIFDMWESYGICYFPDGSSCEERDYYNWECEPKSNNTWDQSDINDFESCVQAGYPILESYPRQCKTPDWQTFVEELDEKNEKQKDNEEEENNEEETTTQQNNNSNTGETINTENEDIKVVCAMDAKECPDGSFVSRIWPDCEFAPCPKINESNNSKDQTDVKEILEKCKPGESWLNEDNIDCIEDIIEYFE